MQMAKVGIFINPARLLLHWRKKMDKVYSFYKKKENWKAVSSEVKSLWFNQFISTTAERSRRFVEINTTQEFHLGVIIGEMTSAARLQKCFTRIRCAEKRSVAIAPVSLQPPVTGQAGAAKDLALLAAPTSHQTPPCQLPALPPSPQRTYGG